MLNFCRKIPSIILLALIFFGGGSAILAKESPTTQIKSAPKESALHITKPGEKPSSLIIEINKGVLKPVSVAINMTCHDESICNNISNVVKNDLQSTALFRTIPDQAFMQKLTSLDDQPQYSSWKIINAQYLLNAQMSVSGGKLQVVLALYDVVSERKIGAISIHGPARNWRKIAHIISNYVYERVTGEQGYFDTRIMYVALGRTRNGGKTHRIAIMDQDGHNHRYLTNGATTVLTPRLSPNGRWFAFFAYKEKIVNGRRVPISASIYRGNTETGEVSLMMQADGMTYAPRYSPDGRSFVFCVSRKGSSSIWSMDLESEKRVRLTRGVCIDTSPSFSPDGRYIVFNSDRAGTQQLYIMDANGANIRRLSFEEGFRYASPVWSPRGDWIAFTKFRGGTFYIGIIRPDGSGERVLASGYLLEGPTWSPNGRVLMHSQQDYSRREKIFSVDITGNNKREINTPGDAIDPEWSTGTNRLRNSARNSDWF